MTRGRPRKIARRDDWHMTEEVQLADGRAAMLWNNIVTGEVATLLKGVHPMDNQNAIVAMPPPDVDEPDDGSDNEPEMTAAERVAMMLRGLDDADDKATVRVYKVLEDSKFGALGWCRVYTPQEFEQSGLDLIRDEFGPGKYQIRLYGPRPGSNQFSCRARETVEIVKTEPKSAAAIDPALAQILSRMNEKLDAVAAAPRVDPTEQLKQTLSLMTMMREAMGMNQTQPQPPSQSNMIADLLKTVQAMRTIREEIEPPQVPDDPLAAVLPKVIDLVSAATQHQPQQNPAAPLPALTVPPSFAAAPSQQQPQAQPQAQPETEDEMQLMFRAAVALLNRRAAENSDVEESAEMVYENAPDELFAVLHRDNWFELLTEVAPSVKPFRDWYSRVRDAVLKIEAEESEPQDKAPKPAKPQAVKSA